LRKRFYILFVARDDDGQLRKIPIPVHYLYIFVVGAAVGFLSLTGIASSYVRMLLKVSSYNRLRTEKDDLKDRYSRLEQVAKERDVQVASLGSLASEVSSLYGLKSDPILVTGADEQVRNSEVSSSLDQLYALKNFSSDRRHHDRAFARPDPQCHYCGLGARELRAESVAGGRPGYRIVW